MKTASNRQPNIVLLDVVISNAMVIAKESFVG